MNKNKKYKAVMFWSANVCSRAAFARPGSVSWISLGRFFSLRVWQSLSPAPRVPALGPSPRPCHRSDHTLTIPVVINQQLTGSVGYLLEACLLVDKGLVQWCDGLVVGDSGAAVTYSQTVTSHLNTLNHSTDSTSRSSIVSVSVKVKVKVKYLI